MAYKCIRSCFAKQLFEEDVIYDSIGEADENFFEVVEADDEDVVETGLPDNRADVLAALDELGIDYNGRLGLPKLQAILKEAQDAALSS